MSNFQKSIFELIRRTATELPADVREALVQAKNREAKSSNAELALSTILQNLEIAKRKQVPLCQDTGFPSFFVRAPAGFDRAKLEKAILAAVREATAAGLLRPNAVDALTGENSDDNTGAGFPAIYFSDHPLAPSIGGGVEIELLLKGGGSENVSEQISLPAELPDYGRADRNLAGVKKAVLQIVKKAEGKGCAPGIVGVHIGADRAGGWTAAKKLLLKKIGELNENPELAKLESEILHEANALGIGPMGFGGKTTLLDCRVSASHRLPASFFVTVAYMCWAARRGRIVLGETGSVILSSAERDEESRWDNSNNSDGILRCAQDDKTPHNDKAGAKVKRLQIPLTEAAARDLKVGDLVLLSGRIFTGRDQLHAYVAGGGELPKDLKDSAIYHCGPVAIQEGGEWVFKAAGPTTSIREEPYEADFIAKTGVRAVIGKGGMGPKTAAALKKHGAVYLHAIGGAAAFYAEAVRKVHGVDFLEWGVPEALWEIEVEDFLAVVTMAAGE
jgi:fumarate hydratase class I